MKKFSYIDATEYLDKCLVFGIKPGLERIMKILNILGEPHKKTDFIHIVGSNGKTSTATMTAAILCGQGFRGAYHISPHISEYTERFWLCGNNISKKRFASLFSSIFPVIEEVNNLDKGGNATQFEIISAMAFLLAAEEHLDVMALEAGMGGRWDATNVADSKIVGLTGVSLEHTAILGKTIKEIAIEKAEVIKPRAKVATTGVGEPVLSILKDKTEKTGSRLYIFGKDFNIVKMEKRYLKGWNVDIKGIYDIYNGLFIPILGNYQPYNLSLALALSELYLEDSGSKINHDSLRKSLSVIKVAGRFEILGKRPIVIADASHNPEGIQNLVKNISENFEGRKKLVIFSVLKDKDYVKMLGGIMEISDTIILTSSNTSRSLPIEILKKELYKLLRTKEEVKHRAPVKIYTIDTIANSLNFALKISDSNDMICITGSITNLEDIV